MDRDPAEGPIRVLHVDDESDFADLVSTYLERETDSIEVLTERSAEDGLSRLAETGVDCVVSDYEMPGTDGLEFLDAVREEYPDLPFILFTGKGSEAVASEAISAGVTDYLQKGGGTDQYTVLANRIENAVDHYRSERALAASEKRLSLFLDQSPLGVIEWNTDLEFVQVNEAATEILGYTEAELDGRSVDLIASERDREGIDTVLDRLLEDEDGYHSISENLTGDGERIICEWHNRVVTDDADEVVAVFSHFQDVTEREEHKRRLETLIENLPGMVYRCRHAPGWPMEFVSGECEELTGYPVPVLEKNEVQYGTDIVHPDDRERVWNTVEEALADDEAFELTYRIRTRDGDQKWVWERGRGIRSVDGELEGVEGFISDVTDQKEREGTIEALHDATRRSITAETETEIADITTEVTARLLDLPLTGIHLYDDDRNALVPVAWTGTVEETIGDPPPLGPGTLAWDTFRSGETRMYNDLEAFEEVNSAETPLRSELIVPLGGHGVVLVASTDPDAFGPEDRRLVELLCANTTAALDRTAREKTLRERERELERENERLDMFTSVASHDLRNPLNVAMSRLELARRECESDHLDGVSTALDRMDTLITDMLTLAREGKSVSEFESVHVSDLAEHCWANVETTTAALVTDADITVRADRSRLSQLFENLFRNGVEHGSTSNPTQSGDAVEHGSTSNRSRTGDSLEHACPEVTITVEAIEGGFAVEDDGPGIPVDKREEVFDIGYSTNNDSTGFGLSIVRDIAEAHGWETDVTDGTDGGARFEFTGVDVVD